MSSSFDSTAHYESETTIHEREDLEECAIDIRNIGWTLGNDYPYRCTHCYSMSARRKGMALSRSMIERVVGQLAPLRRPTDATAKPPTPGAKKPTSGPTQFAHPQKVPTEIRASYPPPSTRSTSAGYLRSAP